MDEHDEDNALAELQRRYLDALAEGTRANGRHYGYPACCIDHFVELLLASAPAWEDHLHDGVGGVIAWATPNLRYPTDPVDPTIHYVRCPACIQIDHRVLQHVPTPDCACTNTVPCAVPKPTG